MKDSRVFVEIGYYEIFVRPFINGSDVPGKYLGCGGLFNNRKNLFRNITSCMNYLESKKWKFDDTIHISIEYSDFMYERYPQIMQTIDFIEDFHGDLYEGNGFISISLT